MNEPAIDPTVFNEISELMDDALTAFIETYLENSPRLLESINLAMDNADMDTLIDQAHLLRGGSGSIGAMQVFHISSEIENKARDGESDGLDSRVAALNSAYAQAAAELKSRL